MTVFIVGLSILLALSYVGLVIYILNAWNQIPLFVPHSDVESYDLSLSIIISARNEEENIVQCLDSILKDQSPLDKDIRVIVVDDFSTDSTLSLLHDYEDSRVTVLTLRDHISESERHNAYKKLALDYGLQSIDTEYVIQLDADVIVGKEFLYTTRKFLAMYYPDFATGIVMLYPVNSLLQEFQYLDLIGMMGVTAAGIQTKKWYMANGANMLYKKKDMSYGNLEVASGDDFHSIQEAASREKIIGFVKSQATIVKTAPMTTLKDLASQRLRWGTKNKDVNNYKMLLMMALPYLNALILLCGYPIFLLMYGKLIFSLWLFHLTLKLMIDYIYLRSISEDLGQTLDGRPYVRASVMQLLYLAIIGTLSLFVKKYNWKDREVQ